MPRLFAVTYLGLVFKDDDLLASGIALRGCDYLRPVDDWLANPTGSRVILLTGGPGTGKSAVAERLAQMSFWQAPPDTFTHLDKGGESFILLSIPVEERNPSRKERDD